MIALAATAAAALLAVVSREAVPQYVESRIQLEGDLKGYECPDVDHDGRGDLAAIVRKGAERTLLVFRQGEGGGFAAEPYFRLVVPAEAISYAFFDLTGDAALELLLFSRSGVFSLSPARAGLKDNLKRELSVPLFPDVPDAGALPRFPYAVDLEGDGRAELLLPTAERLAIYRRGDAGGGAALIENGSLPCRVELERPRTGAGIGLRARASAARGGLPQDWFGDLPATVPRFGEERYLQRSTSWKVPALCDWTGDGRVDGALFDAGGFDLFPQAADGVFPEHPRRVELPEALRDVDDRRFVELGGGSGKALVSIRSESGGLTQDYSLTVLPILAGGQPAKEPSARVKLASGNVQFEFQDVDGDGRQDVVARTADVPVGIATLSEVRLDIALFVFLGEPDGALSERPAVRFERRLKPEQLERIQESLLLDLSGDFDGDGRKDLVLLRSDGLLQVLRLERSGSDLRFAETPLSQYLPMKAVRGVQPEVLSDDGVSDLVLRHEDALTVFVSQGGSRR